MKFEDNPYYHPEKCGLEKVAELEHSSGSFEFDTQVVWRHLDSGKLYWAEDSGCSCPIPFEGTELEHMEEIRNLGAFRIRAMEKGYSEASYANKMEFIEKVEKAFYEEKK